GAIEAVANEFEHFNELTEDEDLVTFVAELFDAFEEGIEFGAGEIAMRGIDQCRVSANLAEAEESRENVEANGLEGAVGVDAEKLGASAFEFGVVEPALFAFEFDNNFILGARRE